LLVASTVLLLSCSSADEAGPGDRGPSDRSPTPLRQAWHRAGAADTDGQSLLGSGLVGDVVVTVAASGVTALDALGPVGPARPAIAGTTDRCRLSPFGCWMFRK
jgi:hypothetical protein